MAEMKLTKNELRLQQNKLSQLSRYLPTLQLKKALLQLEVNDTKAQLEKVSEELAEYRTKVDEYAPLLAREIPVDVEHYAKIGEIKRRYENVAGVDVPIFEDVTFPDLNYDLFDTPPWLEGAIKGLQSLSRLYAKMVVLSERRRALERELREVSIRVNLFEKVLIPRCEENIKVIRVFLGDQQLAGVAQAKVAKAKIEALKYAS